MPDGGGTVKHLGVVERFDNRVTLNFRSRLTQVRVEIIDDEAAELAWRVLWALSQMEGGGRWLPALQAVRDIQFPLTASDDVPGSGHGAGRDAPDAGRAVTVERNEPPAAPRTGNDGETAGSGCCQAVTP